MDETHCIVAGDTPMVPGGLANRPSASKAHGCRGGTQLHGRGWEFGIPMEPAMALHGGAKGKDPAGPSESSLGPAVLAPSLGLGAGGTVPRQRQGGVSVSSLGQRRERSQALPEQPLPAAGLPGITSIYWAASRLCTLPSQPYPQPHCPLRQGPCPLPAALTAPSAGSSAPTPAPPYLVPKAVLSPCWRASSSFISRSWVSSAREIQQD